MSVSCLQDVDEVFLSKMDLEGRLESLKEYVCFLTRLYEEVRTCEEREQDGPAPCGCEGNGRRGPYRMALVCGHWCEDSAGKHQEKTSQRFVRRQMETIQIRKYKFHTLSR